RLLLHCLVRSNEERLPNGRERRGIAEVQVQEVGHTHARMQGSGCDVNSLGHALFAGHLAAKKTLARAVPEKPEKQRPAVEVPGMRSGMEEDGIGLKPCGTRLRCAQTAARDLELEDLCRQRSHNSSKPRFSSPCVFTRHAALLVRGRAQGKIDRAARHQMTHFRAVAR